MKTQLFFDDQWLVGRDNLVRHYGRPELIEDAVYRDPYVNTSVGCLKIFFEETIQKYIMLYSGFNAKKESGVFMAQSDDAIHWSPRNVAKEAGIENPMAPNQCIPCDFLTEPVAFLKDDNAPAAERYKVFGSKCYYDTERRCVCYLLTSPDGIHFKNTGIRWHDTLMGCEPLGGAFYNEQTDSFIINCRPIWGDRRVCRVETKDFKTFTQPELVLQADSIDEPLMDIQGMNAFDYEDMKIGFVFCYHVPPEPKDKAMDGKVDCQLAYSLNGRSFQRSLREPFIGNGEPDSLTAGMVWPCNVRQDEKDGTLYITAAASTLEHGYFGVPGSGSILTYKLRRDGFVYLEAAGGEGRLCTRCMYYQGGGFGIHLACPAGVATCALYDDDVVHPYRKPMEGFGHEDCIPFTGDSDFWTPTFKNRNLEELKGKCFMLEIKLKNGRLYALRGNFINMMATEVFRFNAHGDLPTRQGF